MWRIRCLEKKVIRGAVCGILGDSRETSLTLQAYFLEAKSRMAILSNGNNSARRDSVVPNRAILYPGEKDSSVSPLRSSKLPFPKPRHCPTCPANGNSSHRRRSLAAPKE